MSTDLTSSLLEPARLRAVRSIGLAGSPAEPSLDRLARLAARLLRAPMATVTLVDSDRQIFAGCTGYPEPLGSGRETPLTHSICQHVVHLRAPLIVEDVRVHPMLRDGASVRGDGIVAYAGVPLVLPGEELVGTLCAMDRVPRTWEAVDVETLEELAASVVTEIVLLRELEERTRVQEALQASERKLQIMTDSVPGLVYQFVLRPDGTAEFPYVSAAVRPMFGLEPEEFRDASRVLSFIDPEHRAAFDASVAESAATLGPWRWEGRSLSPAGERWVRGMSQPERLSDGSILWNGVMVDITDRKLAEERMRRLEREQAERAHSQAEQARTREILDGITDPFYVVDREWKVVYANTAAASLLGVEGKEVAGQSLCELSPQGGCVLFHERLTRATQEGRSTAGEEFSDRHGRWYGVHAYPCAGGVAVYVQDISDRRAAQEALRESQQQLMESQKMDAIGRLAGAISHDFNNLLTAIRTNTQLILLDVDEGTGLWEDLQEIDAAALRAAALIRQLLAFSRRQAVQPLSLDVNEILVELDRLLRRLVRDDVEYHTVVSPELHRIRADPSQVEQVVLNLVVNARDAMPDGGTIRVETANAPLAEEERGVPAGEYVRLSVCDDGIGMEPEVKERIFEPFFTTKAPDEGTGLGLSTVYTIVRENHGHVLVESEPGKGTRFDLFFPVDRDEEGPEELSAP